MEVKPGYKLTEVGVIPEDWEVEPFSELAYIERGKFTARPRNDPKYYGGDIPFIQTGDVTNSNGRITTYAQTLNAEGLKVSKLFPRGTLFFTIAANIGDVGFAAFDTACPDSLVAIAPLKSCDATWLSYELAKRKADFESIATHNAQLNINLEKLRPYLLPRPSLPEQRAIAAALSDVDALLGGLERLIAKKRDLKQAAMQQLLTGQTRLPGFHGEWELKRLGELAEIVSGGTPKTGEPAYWNGGIKWCTPTDITGCSDKYLVETERTISLLGLNSSGARLLPASALLLCSRATIGELKIASGEVCTNQGFKSLICQPGVSHQFLYYKLLTMKRQMIERAFGSTFLEISKANVAALEIATPPLPEQTAIATVLSDMDAELSALEARRDKTRALKQGMMQELLTGRTRLV